MMEKQKRKSLDMLHGSIWNKLPLFALPVAAVGSYFDFIAILAGIGVAIAGELVANPLLSSLQVPGDVFPEALLYLRIYLIGMPVILLYNFEAAIFRSTGDTKTPLVILTISGILNVLLNLFFVAVLQMTVNGVAIATVVSNAVSSALLFYGLVKTKELIHVEWKELRIDWKY